MILSELIFATSNRNKLTEASEILGREISGRALELDELQSTDLETVTRHKAAQAYAQMQLPVIVEDTSLVFHAWGKLPGPFIKFFLEQMGPEGLVRALKPFGDMSAEAICGVGYHDGKSTRYFEGRVSGMIAAPAGDRGFGWDVIFRPEGGERTFGQMEAAEKHALSMRARALQKLAEHLRA